MRWEIRTRHGRISSGEKHIFRIKDIVAGQKQRSLWLSQGSIADRRIKRQPQLTGEKHYISSGKELEDNPKDRMFEILSGIISRADPHGKLKIAKLMRKSRKAVD